MSTKGPLKIFVDAYVLNKEHQGTKTYVKELYKEFAQQHPDVHLVFGILKDSEVTQEFVDYPNISFHYYKHSSRMYRMLFEIPTLIKKELFDFAHFQYVLPFTKSKKTKYVVTIHDVLFEDYPQYFSIGYRLSRHFLFKRSARQSDILITVSKFSKEKLERHYSIKKPIWITPNGVSDNYFMKPSKKKSKEWVTVTYGIQEYVLYVSRLEPRKNHHTLLEAFLTLGDPRLHLVFVGSTTIANKQLDKILNSVSVEQRKKIHFLDQVSESDLIHLYNAAEVFVYPSLVEGFGIPPLEAAALETPVICSSTTAMEDFNFFAPFHMDLHQSEPLVSALQKVRSLSDNNRLQHIAQHVQEHYSWKVPASVLTSIYVTS